MIQGKYGKYGRSQAVVCWLFGVCKVLNDPQTARRQPARRRASGLSMCPASSLACAQSGEVRPRRGRPTANAEGVGPEWRLVKGGDRPGLLGRLFNVCHCYSLIPRGQGEGVKP